MLLDLLLPKRDPAQKLSSLILPDFGILGVLPRCLILRMKKEYLTTNSGQTKKLGKELAKKIAKTSPKKEAFVIALDGELGGGKTTFIQGFAKGLGVGEKILSPTFAILKRFKIKDLRFKFFYHFDCYRIKSSEELINLGFKEIVENPQNIIAIEWAERVNKILPRGVLKLKFEFIDEKTRKIELENEE